MPRKLVLILITGFAVLAAAVFGLAAGIPGFSKQVANAAVSQQATGNPLGQNVAYYPSVIRLQHSGGRDILATYSSFDGPNAKDPIFESTDDGRTFTQIATIDPGATKGMCCTSLYELPRQVGSLPAGTVLWAGDKNADARPMSLPIWQSQDQGHTWSFLSTCATSPNSGGLWEPELSVDDSGKLNCYFSDESNPAHSQLLARTVSSDGVHWGPKQTVVALPNRTARPGMVVVRPLPDGRYFMTYELCTTTNGECPVYFRVSSNGSDWGDPATPGTQVVGPGGQFPAHTPKFTVTPTGRIVLGSQTYDNPNGSMAPGNGKTLLVNDSAGAGTWSEIPAPVNTGNNPPGPCINYSPALLSVGDGANVLEISTGLDAGTCKAYYATGPSSPQ